MRVTVFVLSLFFCFLFLFSINRSSYAHAGIGDIIRRNRPQPTEQSQETEQQQSDNFASFIGEIIGVCIGIAIAATVWFIIAKNKNNLSQMRAAIITGVGGILTYLYGLLFFVIAAAGFGVYKLADVYIFKKHPDYSK